MTQYIVLSGRKSSGKTTTANIIKKLILQKMTDDELARQARDYPDDISCWGPLDEQLMEHKIRIKSFASPIKEICHRVLGLTEEQVYGSEEQKNTETRFLWDNMPAEIRERYGGQKWNVIHLRYEPNKHGPMTAREVMQIFGTDIIRKCFDENLWAELAFKDNYSPVVTIIDDCRFPNEADIALKHGALLVRLTRNVNTDEHISEKAMDDYPKEKYSFIIDNQNTTIEELENSVRQILKNTRFI